MREYYGVDEGIMGEPEFERPLNQMTAPEVLEDEGRFVNFVRALGLSGAGGMLENKGPYTIFAPADDVFNVQTMGALLGSARLDDLLYHFIVPGKYMSADLRRLQLLRTVNGYPLVIVSHNSIEVNGATIIKPDVPYNRGVIHEINKTMEP
jgi:uncharacterized surface protein with fasciclin (FAS1) repeats